MIKKITYFIFFIILLVFLSVFYLSYFGIKTDKFNNNISNQIKKNYPNLKIEFKEIKLLLNLLNFSLELETSNPKIYVENYEIKLKKIYSNYNFFSFFKKEFGIDNINFETKNNEIKHLIKFLRINKDNSKLYILDKAVKNGEIAITAKINFDKKGNIKDNYKIEGEINNLTIKLLNKEEINNLNLNFDYLEKNLNLTNISLNYLNFEILSEKIAINEEKKFYNIKGVLKNSKKNIPKEITSIILKNNNFENLILSSENNFSLKLSKEYEISNIKIKSKINLDEVSYNLKNNLVKNYIPIYEDKFKLTDHILYLEYNNNLSLKGNGKIEIGENKKDEIKYNLNFIEDKLNYDLNLTLNTIPIKLDIINFFKQENEECKLKIKGTASEKKNKIKRINFDTKDVQISGNDFELSKKYKIANFEKFELNYTDENKRKNDLIISKNNNEYAIKGKNFDLTKIIDEILTGDNDNSFKLFDKKNRIFKINFEKNFIDKEHYFVDLKGRFKINNNEIYDMDLSSKLSNNENISLSIKSKNNTKVTTFYSDLAKPFVKKFKFIKGFENGKIDFSSLKKNKISSSKLKIYDFKLNELPALTKILTLASLQGIADILSGEGVGFDELEMNFKNKEGLMEIEELYAIGPAISILMDGYVKRNNIISLRGTLVPATTINKFVSSIPILGDILVGKKTGEGVFGVSFKIKGPPKKTKTTVNPIKTLTPRFITRTLEKIKKTN